jgi:hypothetical protein
MLSIYDGRRCIGFLVSRGPKGCEAFDPDGRSLGRFPTQQEAADAVSVAAEQEKQ